MLLVRVFVLAFIVQTLAVTPTTARKVAETWVPDSREIDGRSLVLNGAGLYEATVLQIDIYVAALYLMKPTDSGIEAARCDGPVQFDQHWLYDPSRSDLLGPWREQMRANAGDALPQLADRIEALLAVLVAPNVGDTWRFSYTPERGMQVIFAGRLVLTIPGKDFCTLFIWGHVGPKGDADVRRGLLGG